ncbi:hypothetical protein PORY_001588 [Pneumocystis oryctolagi]|uniref:Uncharacterized protein n=1 Tax=Pneumocystis oryctolagi TaxID=42067 RepID=A0ACB7CD97_9ASCO|nr:hypothetical protein PORY_001588 [Pneumocystis oryctolagi]
MSDNKTETVYEIQSTEDYEKFISSCGDQIIVLNFYANWAQPCQYMNTVFQELSLKFFDIKFANINAEELDDISESFEISIVPFFIILQSKKVLAKMSGANPSELTETISRFSKKIDTASIQSPLVSSPKIESRYVHVSIPDENRYEDLTNRLEKLVKAKPVMLFMKGTPENPQCGFSRQIVNILNDFNVKYGFFNILADEEIRAGLKEFSDWPTYPQLYIQGNFCGGLDIVREMIKTGEIQKLFQESGMVKSQLKQLKIALKEAGISTSNRRTKKKKDRQNRVDRTAILENIRSQFNHYEKKVNKVKHNVGGRRLKGIEGRPIERSQTEEEKRKKTILVDMLRRNKVGGIVDRRFGENNAHLSLEEKMLQRYTVEKQKLHKKNNIYNLEDEDDFSDFGQSLEDIEGFEDVIDVNNEKDFGDIDFETVNNEHFGGFKSSELDNNKKTKSEVMKEIIAKSKIRKYERQKNKEEDDMEREMLDVELDDLRLLLSKNGNVVSPKVEEKQLSRDIQYDLAVKELAYEKRAYPSSRTKTEEEIAYERAEKLQKLEEERLKRMKYEDLSEDEEIENMKETETFFSERNSFENSFTSNNDIQTDNDTEFYSFEKEASEEYKQKEENGIFQYEDGPENILDLDKDIIRNLSCDNIAPKFKNTDFKTLDNSKDSNLEKKKQKPAYVYPCPNSLSEFLLILKNIQQEDIPKVVNRIKVLYHPSLHPSNKEKLQSFIVVLLDFILYLSEKKNASLITLDILSEHLRDLSNKYPQVAYEAFHKKLKNLREKFNQLLFSEKKGNFFPSIQDLVFLRIIGVIFSTSDLSHIIVTPTLLIMGQLLSQLKIISLKDICLKLYLITLFAEYINLSKRIVPEVINTLLDIIKNLFQRNNRKKSNKEISVDSKNYFFDLSSYKPRTLKISDIYFDDNDNSKELEVSLFKTTAQLIDHYAYLWNGKPAFIEIFSPCLNLLKTFSNKISLFPELQTEIDSINERISKLLHFSSQSRKPLMLQAHKPVPIPSFIPKFENQYSLDKKSYDPNRERAESAKLRFQYRDTKKGAIRMLRKDAQFIARETEKIKREKDITSRVRKIEVSIPKDAQFIARETEKIKREKDIHYSTKMKKIYGQLTQKD